METERKDADPLEALFAEARAEAPPEALMARVLADAETAQGACVVTPVRRGWLSGVISALGGWPGASGVALAGVAGVMVGFYAPDMVDAWTGGQVWSLGGGAGFVPEIGGLWLEDGDV